MELKTSVKTKLGRLQEETRVSRFIKTIREATFSVLCALLQKGADDDDLSVHFVRVCIDYLQILAFLFDPKLLKLWQASNIFSFIVNIFSYFSIKKYFVKLIYPQLFLFAIYAFVLFVFLIAADVVYVAVSFQRKMFKQVWPLKALRYFSNVILSVIFLPVISTLSQLVC